MRDTRKTMTFGQLKRLVKESIVKEDTARDVDAFYKSVFKAARALRTAFEWSDEGDADAKVASCLKDAADMWLRGEDAGRLHESKKARRRR